MSQSKQNANMSAEEGTDQPLFLRKAYAMINSCPPEIGGWSAKGDSFYVKDVDAFASKVIPTFYKHNNFASFVRQLNFYGFRKIRSDISHASHHVSEFQHPLFIKGKPHLLTEIKKPSHTSDTQNDKEVQKLRNTVSGLQEKVSDMSDSIAKLTGLVQNLLLRQQQDGSRNIVENTAESENLLSQISYINSYENSMVKTEHNVNKKRKTSGDATDYANATEEEFFDGFYSGEMSDPAVDGINAQVHGLAFVDSPANSITEYLRVLLRQRKPLSRLWKVAMMLLLLPPRERICWIYCVI